MTPTAAQLDLRRAHVNGGAGVIVSGLAWLAAAIAFLAAGPKPAFVTLFVCGLAIAPVAGLVERFVFKAAPSTTGKRWEWIAIATVPVLLGGFFIGWFGMAEAPFAAVPIVAIGVGLRYLAFPVMFGTLVFALLGAVFIAAGVVGILSPAAAPWAALGLGIVELAAGTMLVKQWRGPARPA